MRATLRNIFHLKTVLIKINSLAHFSIGDWKDIIIIKSEVSTFPIVIIFSVVVCLRCLLHHILSLIAYIYIYVPGKPRIWFHYYCAVYDACKYSDTFWLADRTRFFVQYTISLTSLWKLNWRHWTYKMPVRYILSSVWVRLSTFSPLYIIQYVGLYVFSLPISLVMIERIYILCLSIITKSEVWTITHCLGLGHETMVSALCLSIFFWKRCSIQLLLMWFFWRYMFRFMSSIPLRYRNVKLHKTFVKLTLLTYRALIKVFRVDNCIKKGTILECIMEHQVIQPYQCRRADPRLRESLPSFSIKVIFWTKRAKHDCNHFKSEWWQLLSF